MKHFRFVHFVFGLSLLFLISCGGGGSEKTSAADSTAMADSAAKAEKAAAEAKAMSTIVTTTQYFVVVTHKVANYAKWFAAYEGHDSARLASGLHNYVIGRGVMKDSNTVLVALKADDTSKAKAFAMNPGMKKTMQKAGVVGAPTISFTTSVWQDTANIDSKIRSRSTFMVKDWDVWVKTFQDGKQQRMDNGLVDRNVSHDLDNNKKVYLVLAVTDTAKAMAYWKSDALKKRREEGRVGSGRQ